MKKPKTIRWGSVFYCVWLIILFSVSLSPLFEPAYKMGLSVYDFFAPVYYRNCKTRPVSFGVIEQGDKNSQYGYTEKIVQNGNNGIEQVCEASKRDYPSKITILTEPTPKIIEYTPKPKPEIYIPRYYNGGGGAICRDGTRSYSTGRGTCSWHGGVAQWL